MSQRPCHCRNVTGSPYTYEQCRRCWLAEYDARYVAWKDAPAVAAPPAPDRTIRCRHRGGPTGALVGCATCPGRDALGNPGTRPKLFACAVHVDCTLAKPVSGHACCQTCTDYAPVE